MLRRRWLPLLGAVWMAACGRTGPHLVTIDSLASTSLNVTASRTPDQASVGVVLDFAQLGENLGDDCPVIMANGTVNGVAMVQQATGGPNPCDDPPFCESAGKCRVPTWLGTFPSGFPPSADGLVTVELTDAGKPATLVSALDVWADATLSAVTDPAPADASPQATLTVTLQPPYSGIAPDEATETTADPGEPLLQVLFSTSAGDTDTQTTPAGTPNTFEIAFPPATDLARPVAGQLSLNLFFGTLPAQPPTTTWSGVDSFSVSASAQLAPLSVTLP